MNYFIGSILFIVLTIISIDFPNCSSVIVNGGESLMTSSCVFLAINPASRNFINKSHALIISKKCTKYNIKKNKIL